MEGFTKWRVLQVSVNRINTKKVESLDTLNFSDTTIGIDRCGGPSRVTGFKRWIQKGGRTDPRNPRDPRTPNTPKGRRRLRVGRFNRHTGRKINSVKDVRVSLTGGPPPPRPIRVVPKTFPVDDPFGWRNKRDKVPEVLTTPYSGSDGLRISRTK